MAAATVTACSTDPKTVTTNDFGAKAAALYTQLPDISHCKSGTLSEEEKKKAVSTLNEIRKLHGLEPVAYDYASDNEVMESSLIFAANGTISHQPQETLKCYSKNGTTGASESNIGGGPIGNIAFKTTPDDITSWLTESTNTISNNVGHRRFMLNPFLNRVAYGRVTSKFKDYVYTNGSAMKVVYDNTVAATNTASNTIIAYPFQEYPAKFFDSKSLLSASILIDNTNFWNNKNVDFSKAQIKAIARGEGPVAIKNVSTDNAYFGLPNNIQFSIPDLAPEKTYDIEIDNVSINGVQKNISYWFKVASK